MTGNADLAEEARKLFSGPIDFLKSAPELRHLPDPVDPAPVEQKSLLFTGEPQEAHDEAPKPPQVAKVKPPPADPGTYLN